MNTKTELSPIGDNPRADVEAFAAALQAGTNLWTLKEGIELARKFEAAIIPVGYHCALGGSVLHRGWSGKDLDIFVYPHKSVAGKNSRYPAKNALTVLGVSFCKNSASHHDDEKLVIAGSFEGKRIDFFFLS